MTSTYIQHNLSTCRSQKLNANIAVLPGATPAPETEGGVDMTALLSFVVLAGIFATPPTLPAPALCSSAPAAVQQPSFGGRIHAKSTCIADCGDLNPSVSCSGSSCSAQNQDQSCPGGPGHVTCDGQTTYCAPCCTNGTFRTVIVGPTCGCADGMTTPRDRYQCMNGLWEYQSSLCGGPFCQGFN